MSIAPRYHFWHVAEQAKGAAMTVTREVSWGEGIVVEVFRTHGGLRTVVQAITDEVGATVGTRNTFAKLLRVEDPSTLGERDRWRAWLLLTALHQDPAEWGIGDGVVPRSLDADLLASRLRSSVRRQGLEPRTRWLRALPLLEPPLELPLEPPIPLRRAA